MSKVYKPIDLVSIENNYKAYAVVIRGKEVIFLRNSQELKELFEKCSEDELSIYALQSVVRAQKVNGSDDYNDYDDDDGSDTDNEVIDEVADAIDEITQTFNSSLKAIISKIK